jgi:hypothetical protein
MAPNAIMLAGLQATAAGRRMPGNPLDGVSNMDPRLRG